MHRVGRVLVAAALLLAAGCHRETKVSDPAAALEKAYQAGLLTKEEYEAKKVAMSGKKAEPAPAPLPPVAEVKPEPKPEPPPEPKHDSTRPQAVAKSKPKSVAVKQSAALPIAEPPAITPPPVAAPTPAERPAPAPPPPIKASTPAPAKARGCDDADTRPGVDSGTQEKTFAASPEAVRNAAMEAFAALDFQIQKDNSSFLEARKKKHLGAIVGAGGEHVVLTLEKTQQGTRVTAKTVKTFTGRLAQKNWTNAVLAQLACRLHR